MPSLSSLRFTALLLAALATTPVLAAPPAGHLNVPASQMLELAFGLQMGGQPHQQFLFDAFQPDGKREPISNTWLASQTLVMTEMAVMVLRTTGTATWPESGHLILVTYDITQKGQTPVRQSALLTYTLPASTNRMFLNVPLPAGRAFSGNLMPMLSHVGSPSIQLVVSGFGYLVKN